MNAIFRKTPEPDGVQAVLAFGSNVGDREGTIGQSITDIDGRQEITVESISPLYETPAIKPQGVDLTAPRYLNGVVIVRTTLSPHALLDAVNTIERGYGRVRESLWDDRTLDIDIITYGDLELCDATLMIPHPRAWQRAFVLQPWLDLDPGAELPGYGPVSTLREMAEDEVRPFEGDSGSTTPDENPAADARDDDNGTTA